MFCKYGLGCYYIASGCLITGIDYRIWNGRMLLFTGHLYLVDHESTDSRSTDHMDSLF